MGHIKTKDFFSEEATPILDKVKGPVDSFVLRNEQETLANAVETGSIPEGSFRDCAVFNDEPLGVEQKRFRYDSLKAREIQRILDEDKASEDLTIDDKAAMIYANKTVQEAVVVEAARKLIREGLDGTLTAPHEQLYGDQLDKAQAELYPTLDQPVAAYARNLVLQMIQSVDEAQAAEIVSQYPFLVESGGEQQVRMLSEEKRAAWHNMLHESYDPVFNRVQERMIESDTQLQNNTLKTAVTYLFEELGIPLAHDDQEGWMIIERDDISGFKVEPKIKEFHIGKRKTEITEAVFEQLMLHEVIWHVTRAENGHRKGSRALATGLPGNAETEEGAGILLESLWSGKDLDVVGRDHFRYMAVAFASGVYDGQMHTEEETFSFITTIMVAQKPDSLHDDTAVKAARKLGFDHVKRPFRGMPEGKRMMSNLAYLSGKLKMIEVLEDSDADPRALLTYLQQGKFNPIDPTHEDFIEAIAA